MASLWRSYTFPVTFAVPQWPTCQHDPGLHDSIIQLDFSMHHRLHAYSDIDAVLGASTT